MNTDFIDNSNARAQQEKRWCYTHPTAFWGKNQYGNWYERCAIGHKVNEDCRVGEDDKVSER